MRDEARPDCVGQRGKVGQVAEDGVWEGSGAVQVGGWLLTSYLLLSD